MAEVERSFRMVEFVFANVEYMTFEQHSIISWARKDINMHKSTDKRASFQMSECKEGRKKKGLG